MRSPRTLGESLFSAPRDKLGRYMLLGLGLTEEKSKESTVTHSASRRSIGYATRGFVVSFCKHAGRIGGKYLNWSNSPGAM